MAFGDNPTEDVAAWGVLGTPTHVSAHVGSPQRGFDAMVRAEWVNGHTQLVIVESRMDAPGPQSPPPSL